jgi:hypothetical protein
MDINASMIFPIAFFSALILCPMSYWVVKDKCHQPSKYAVVTLMLSFIPPFAMLYVALLSFKRKTN